MTGRISVGTPPYGKKSITKVDPRGALASARLGQPARDMSLPSVIVTNGGVEHLEDRTFLCEARFASPPWPQKLLDKQARLRGRGTFTPDEIPVFSPRCSRVLAHQSALSDP
jgi:hypothetical protein